MAKSEKASGKRRGRPRKEILDPDLQRKVDRGGFGRSETRRGKQNDQYRIRAYQMLDMLDHPQLAWLKAAGRDTLLTELGRIDNRNLMASVAATLGNNSPLPSNERAIRQIKALRNKLRDPEGDSRVLSRQVIKAVNQYRLRHPKMSLETVQNALLEALKTVS